MCLRSLAIVSIALTILPTVTLALPALHVQGSRLVDENGHAPVLRGCNLGSWLLIEPWMLALQPQPEIRDHYSFVQTLTDRFGAERADVLMDSYRSNWISDREFELLKTFGFNLVRVPFYHGLLANEAEPFKLRPDAFQWLDRAVELGEKHGVYVILDMHGAPGGQSIDMPSGRVDENRLWTDESCQKRFVWMWEQIAERYANRSAVVAYDLVNEPFGDFNSDDRPKLIELMDRVQKGIRQIDKQKLLFVPATLRGLGSYRPPAEHGWHNVGYTEHWYPGLFGTGSPGLETHLQFLNRVIPAKAEFIEAFNAPFLVGEFNVVFDTAGQPYFMRRYFDTYAQHGWLATMWALRMIQPRGGVEPNNWYLVVNAEPFQLPDLQTASYEQIEAAFAELGVMPLAVDEELRSALTSATPPDDLPLPAATRATTGRQLPDGPTSIDGWTGVDIASQPRGGQIKRPDGAYVLYGGGSDIWEKRDEFHFLQRKVEGDFCQRVWLTDFDATQPHAKAGVMARAGLSPDAAHVVAHAFCNGIINIGWRKAAGETMQERSITAGGWPVGLGIERKGGELLAHYTDPEGVWRTESLGTDVVLGDKPHVGMFVMSHDDTILASAAFHPCAADCPPPRSTSAPNLLLNGSFEEAQDADASDRAAHWNRWGHWFNRETGWTPTRDGDCLLGYHHWKIEEADSSGWYQDIAVEPPARCTFSVWASADAPAADKHGPRTIELRIEGVDGERIWQIAAQEYRMSDIATDGKWSHLHVTGTVPTRTARVLIVIDPSRQEPRDAALKFDNASLQVAADERTQTGSASPVAETPERTAVLNEPTR